jgi:DNA-binding IclR family transcriptional regulator
MDATEQPAAKAPARKRTSTRDLTRGNSTILIGAQLLSVVAGFDGATNLTKIAVAANMSPSRAYRYLRGLCDAGLLEQHGPSGLYDLGPQTLSLGLKAIGRLDPLRQATAMLPHLTNSSGLMSVITVWGSHGPTAVRCEHGNIGAPIVNIREGISLSLFKTSAGRVFLTYLPHSKTEPVIEREIVETDWWATYGGPGEEGERSHKDLKKVMATVAKIKSEVREHDMARSLGTQHPSYASLSAPVFGRDGELQLAISLIGVQGTFDIELSGRPAGNLRMTAQKLSEQLGGKAPEPSI